jgi:hypothetical protein
MTGKIKRHPKTLAQVLSRWEKRLYDDRPSNLAAEKLS